MDRNARALILALLCVLAVSLAAATLVNPQSTGGGDGAVADDTVVEPDGNDDPPEDGEDENTDDQSHEMFAFTGICVPFLLSSEFFVLATAVIVLTVAALKRRQTLPYALAVVFPLLMFLTPLWLLTTNCNRPETQLGGDPLPPIPEGVRDAPSSGPGGEASAAEQLLSPPALLALLVVVGIVLAFLVYRASGDDTVEEPDEPIPVQEQPEDDATLAAVGAAAGAAADRIEDATDVENEVYRAWREMTTHIDVPNPESSTPGEFATAASDIGMADEHVDTLTALFRDVRYGGREATEDREQRAVDALRAIEDQYADGGDD